MNINFGNIFSLITIRTLLMNVHNSISNIYGGKYCKELKIVQCYNNLNELY